MSARSQVTLWAQGGGVEEDVTLDQVGSPERLEMGGWVSLVVCYMRITFIC